MEKAYRDGLVVQLKPGAVPQYKKYLQELEGEDGNELLDRYSASSGQRSPRISHSEAACLFLNELFLHRQTKAIQFWIRFAVAGPQFMRLRNFVETG